MDNLEFLDGSPEPNAEAQPSEAVIEQPTQEAQPRSEEAPAGETPAQAEARQRDDKGRFKSKEDTPVMVPLQALHETRDELKALKAQLDALKQPEAQQQSQIPDIFENPEGYAEYLQNQITNTTLNDRLNLSEELVRQSAGDEAVNAAQEWGRQMIAANPGFRQAFFEQRNPYGFLVQQFQRHTLVSQLGDDPKDFEAFIAWRNAQGQTGAQPNPQPSPAPPRSIASATSAGGVQHQAIGPGVAFGEIIK